MKRTECLCGRQRTVDSIRRAQQYGASTAVRGRVAHVIDELSKRGMLDDPARDHLIQTRAALSAVWQQIAETLDRQGEPMLAGDVRHFARHLPPVRTDNERLVLALAQRVRAKQPETAAQETKQNIERTR